MKYSQESNCESNAPSNQSLTVNLQPTMLQCTCRPHLSPRDLLNKVPPLLKHLCSFDSWLQSCTHHLLFTLVFRCLNPLDSASGLVAWSALVLPVTLELAPHPHPSVSALLWIYDPEPLPAPTICFSRVLKQ